MYKVDAKYMKAGRVEGFDYEDFSKNQTNFCRLDPLTSYLWIGEVPNNETTSQNTYTTYSYSIFNKDGVELAKIDSGAKRKIDEYNGKARFSLICEHLAKFAAREPKLVEHIPVEVYLGRTTLGEEILTEYQNAKMEELQRLPAGQDCAAFIEEIKTTVAYMNKTFNNVEKSREVKENFSELFARDKEL